MTIIHKVKTTDPIVAICGVTHDRNLLYPGLSPHRFTMINRRVTCADCDNLLADNTTSSENTQSVNLNDELENAKSWATSAKKELDTANTKTARLKELEYYLRNAAQYLESGETYSLPDYDIHVTRM